MSGHLRLVHPAPPANGKRSYKTHAHVFSDAEMHRLRAALRNARGLFGGWACLADAMYVRPETLNAAANGRSDVSADVAVRLAKALGKPLDALLRAPSDAATCPTCGRRP